MRTLVVFFVTHLVCVVSLAPTPCTKKDYGKGSFVCVCNEVSCDSVEANTPLTRGTLAQYTSSSRQHRLDKQVLKFEANATGSYTYTINRTETFQTVIGFGGAFTDAAGINILSLPPKAQDNLMASYFAPTGIEYTTGRIPMASCDFSTHTYSYDDHPNDFNLTHFSLAPEDLKYKIPIVQKAIALSQRKISIFGSPWSAPAWMKTNNNMTGKGSLIGQAGGPYYQTWANYFVRFLQEYEKHNISMWGLTAQNEPTDGEITKFFFQCMGWTPEQQRDFIIQDLGPALHQNGFSDIKLMILDDTRLMLPYWVEKVLSDSSAAQYIAGVAVHWYLDQVTTSDALDIAHNMFPDKFILGTEACTGELPWDDKVALGSWKRAQQYTHDIIQDLNHWVTGWTDWNIALDTQGGPNWANNFVDSPVIVNATAKEFYKQPMFYALGHFSKFIVPGAKRISLYESGAVETIETVAFLLPDDSVVLVIHNSLDGEYSMTLHDPDLGYANVKLEPLSINTFIWWNK
ncbi:lysosomal acid glucosylceramidase-like isoform X2 [Haliotis asinina]|uniref:lysosomal acid glucosylceramidase-like isoform X2 n=1 Tax=Haliotis asinina TaxID=109174 RepID=UPI0035322358